MIKNSIKEKILKKVIFLSEFGINDLTWEKEDAKKLIVELMNEDIGILGGSVYKIDLKNLIPLYDSWFCEINDRETIQEHYLKSKIKTLEYIDKYPIYQDEKILFSITFSENIN
jgi:hypothetical protein